MVQDSKATSYRLQDGGEGRWQSESRQWVVAHRRNGREARLAQDGIREHEAFLGHEMRGLAWQGLGVVASRWLGGGKAKVQVRRMG